MNYESELQNTFTCPKCGTPGGYTRKVSISGSGLSRFFNFQQSRYIAISCSGCGYTEFYNPVVFQGKNNATDPLDLIFGR